MKSFFNRLRRKPAAAASATGDSRVASGDAPSRPDSVEELEILEELEAAEKAQYLELELGDFLPRIPYPLLCEGPHDPTAPLRFELSDVAERLVRGETTIPLAAIFYRVPQIFRDDVPPAEDIVIRFPWIKMLKLLRASDGGGTGDEPREETSLRDRLRQKREEFLQQPGNAPSPVSRKSAPAGGSGWAVAEPVEATRKRRDLSGYDTPVPPEPTPPEEAEKEPHNPVDPFVELARVRAEYERQIVKLKADRQTAFGYRDKAVAEVEKLREEMRKKLEQLSADRDLALKRIESMKLEREIMLKKIKSLNGARP